MRRDAVETEKHTTKRELETGSGIKMFGFGNWARAGFKIFILGFCYWFGLIGPRVRIKKMFGSD